jgi:hypothetical protein
MEGALAVFALLGALAVLAPRWGVDSRDWPRSPEHTLAIRGFAWGRTERAGVGKHLRQPARPSG